MTFVDVARALWMNLNSCKPRVDDTSQSQIEWNHIKMLSFNVHCVKYTRLRYFYVIFWGEYCIWSLIELFRTHAHSYTSISIHSSFPGSNQNAHIFCCESFSPLKKMEIRSANGSIYMKRTTMIMFSFRLVWNEYEWIADNWILLLEAKVISTLNVYLFCS